MDLWNLLLDFISHLDWIERVEEALFLLQEPDSYRISLDRWAGWSGQQAEDLLAGYGVRIHGRAFDADHLYFWVNPRQGRWAEYLLARAGAPVVSSPIDERNAEWAAQHEPGTLPEHWDIEQERRR